MHVQPWCPALLSPHLRIDELILAILKAVWSLDVSFSGHVGFWLFWLVNWNDVMNSIFVIALLFELDKRV